MSTKKGFFNYLLIMIIFCLISTSYSMKRPMINPVDENLMLAVSIGDYKAAQKAITNGANLSYRNNYGMTALDLAARFNQPEIVKLLINNKVDINLKNFQVQSPLVNASGLGHLPVVKVLIENGADDSEQAIKAAESSGNNDIAKFIKEYRANRKNEIQNTTKIIPDLVDIVDKYEFGSKK